MRLLIQLGSLVLLTTASISFALAQTAPPPSFGEQTKGEPAIEEQGPDATQADEQTTAQAEDEAPDNTDSQSNGILGQATITESRRENGQVYLIEMEHSSGSTLFLEENDSDGKIDTTDNDLESEPNIPKWRLGRW